MKKRNSLVLLLIAVLTVMMAVSAFPAGAIEAIAESVSSPSDAAPAEGETAEGPGVETGNPTLDDSVPVGNPGASYTPSGTGITSTEEFNAMDPAGSYYLAADIAVNTTFAGFCGVFDGNGHTVTASVPLFESPQHATIKNLTVAGNIVVINYDNTAAVASGTAYGCNFFNICNRANVAIAEGDTGSDSRAAGIAGRTGGYTVIERCTNEGTIKGYGISGGLLTLASADNGSELVMLNCVNKGAVTSLNGSAGGVACAVECPEVCALIYGCRNEGAVTGKNGTGGITGYTTASSNGKGRLRISHCSNAGVITATDNNAAGIVSVLYTATTVEYCVNEETGSVYAGTESTSNQRRGAGMVGWCSNVEILITDCVNHANIEGTGQSGGIAGWLNSTTVTVRNCVNNGEVTSRLNYAAGIVCRTDLGAYATDLDILISDCTNNGKISSYKDNAGGIYGYTQGNVTFIRCTNKGLVTYRKDTPDDTSVSVGGIAGCVSAPVVFEDCRNEGELIAKGKAVWAANSGGNAGGIAGSLGNANALGNAVLLRCVNTGKVTSGKPSSGTPTSYNSNYAGGLIGYQYCTSTFVKPEIRYCISTGDVTAYLQASYAIGYMNGTAALFSDNVFAGKLTSEYYPSGANAAGSPVRSILAWNQGNTVPVGHYVRNYVLDTFDGAVINNVASTGAGNPVSMTGYSYTYTEEQDPFDVYNALLAATAEEISTPEQFMAMKPDGNYKLTASFTLPTSYATAFSGILDGNGQTLTVSTPVFTYLNVAAQIKNLTLAGEITGASGDVGALSKEGGGYITNVVNRVNVTGSGGNTGGFIGKSGNQFAMMTDCVNAGTVTVTTAHNAAGFVAYTNWSSRFVNCTNNGAITGGNHVGGIVGESQVYGTTYIGCVNTALITNNYTGTQGKGTGGIQAYNGNNCVWLTDCYNSGDVKGTYAAGILGDSAKGAIVTGCVNTGNITATNGTPVGGIYNHHGDTGAVYFQAINCINTGNISGTGNAGGIVGGMYQIADNNDHIMTSCINVGNVTGTGLNVGSLIGYNWASSLVGVRVTSCIAGGTVTSTSNSVSAICGYANTTQFYIKDTIISATLNPAAGKNSFLYYGSNGSELTAKANISGNSFLAGCADFDAYRANGSTTVAIGGQSTSCNALPALAFAPDVVTREMLLAIGIPSVNGAYSGAIGRLLSAEQNTENKIGVYDAQGTEIAVVSSFADAEAAVQDGYTVKLLADFYSAEAVRIAPRGVTWTFDGNGYTMYFAKSNGAEYMFKLSGDGSTVTVDNLKVFAQTYGVKVGTNNDMAMDVTFRNAVIFAGSRHENGYYNYNGGTALAVTGDHTLLRMTGADTTVKNSSEALFYLAAGLDVEDGTFESRASTALYIVNSKGGMPVSVRGGNFTNTYNIISCVGVSDARTVEVYGGNFTCTGNASCIVLGTGYSRANVTMRVFGGTFTNEVNNANVISGWHATTNGNVGGTPVAGNNGTLEVYGGTFINDGTSRLLKYYGNQNWYFYGGTFISRSDDIIAFAMASGVSDAYVPESRIIFGIPEGFTAPEGVTVQPLSVQSAQSLFYCDGIADGGRIEVDICSGSFALAAENAAISVRGNSAVNVYGGNITMTGNGGIFQMLEESDLTVNGGTVMHEAAALADKNWKSNIILVEANYTGDILVAGGTMTGNSCGIYLNAPIKGGTLTVTGGEITTANQVIYLQATANTNIRLAGGTLKSLNGNVVHICTNGEISNPDAFDEDTAYTFLVEGTVALNAPKGTAIYMGPNHSYILTVNGGVMTAVCALDIRMCGKLIVNDMTAVTTSGYAIRMQNLIYAEINGGSVTTQGGAIETTSTRAENAETGAITKRYYAPRKVVINGGEFIGTGVADALLSFAGVYDSNTEVIIHGGYFENNGMCVARVLAGKTKNEYGTDNDILVEAGTTMTINGGVFLLVDGRDADYSAVVRCGGGSTYGTVILAGGTFINQNVTSSQVVLKNNTCASLDIRGGRFLASEHQLRFLTNSGTVNIETESGYRPTCVRGNLDVDTVYSQKETYADEEYYLWLVLPASNQDCKMEMTEGAQVRMNTGSTGIRFVSAISADKVAVARALAGANGTVSYGTVIAPIDYVMQAGAFTMEALDACTALDGVRAKYADIPAVEGLYVDSAGNVEIRAALINIQQKNYDRGFAAVAYVRVETESGDVTYLYGTFDTAANVRTIRQISLAALADVRDTLTGIYVFLTEDGKYSRYNDHQRSVLQAFVADPE